MGDPGETGRTIRNNQFENKSTGISETEIRREKRMKKMEHNIQEVGDNYKKCNTRRMRIADKEKKQGAE